jgi:hypothetical protein
VFYIIQKEGYNNGYTDYSYSSSFPTDHRLGLCDRCSASANVGLVFTLPISLMLMLNPILGFAFIVPAAQWSMHNVRKNQRLFAQLRQQRDAIVDQAA